MDVTNDIEMQESAPETTIASVPQTTASDLTDPNPPPQPQLEAQPSLPAAVLDSPAPTQSSASLAAPTTIARPGSIPPTAAARPEKPVAHGGPTRQYLNQNITPHLLEGMKHLAMYEPEKPLAWLADFLKDRSKQIEG